MPRNPEQSSSEHAQNRSFEHSISYETPKAHERHAHTEEYKGPNTEKARSEALETAIENKLYDKARLAENDHQKPYTSPRASRKQSFAKTMSRVQNEMPAPQKLFSKIIHLPVIEKTSDVIGSTVARPDAILSGSIAAFIFTTALYFTARYFGFSLSGAETILAFVFGWLLGLSFDLAKKVLGRRA